MSDNKTIRLDRCAYFERAWISNSTKKIVSNKTNGRCAICGKKINVGTDNFTIDHVIPLNQGGSNELENLIPLCYNCNQDKGDKIVRNYNSFKYLKNNYKDEVQNVIERFIDGYNYTYKGNILSFDEASIDVATKCFQSKISGKTKYTYYYTNFIIEKVQECSDELIKFVEDYNSKYNLETGFVREAVSEKVSRGLFYTVKKSKDSNIRFAFYIEVDVNPDDDTEGIIRISNIIHSADVEISNSINAVKIELIRYIVCDILRSFDNDADDCRLFIDMIIENHSASEEYQLRFYDMLSKEFEKESVSPLDSLNYSDISYKNESEDKNNDGFVRYHLSAMFAESEADSNEIENNDKSDDYTIKELSKFRKKVLSKCSSRGIR